MAEKVQVALFNELENRIGSKAQMVKEIVDLLNTTSDSVYRRINGETDLRIDEVIKICNEYHLSLDSMLQLDTNKATFYLHHDLKDSVETEISNGFKHMVDLMERLHQSEGAEIIYFNMELPILHFLEVPELLAFKMYYWEAIRTKQSSQPFQLGGGLKQFNNEMKLVKHLTNLYNRIPSIEIVFKESLSSILTQISSYFDQGRFKKPEDALILFDRLLDLVDHLKYQARIGQKFSFGEELPDKGAEPNFQMFYNDSIFSQNTALVRSNKEQMVYLEHNVINFLYTYDASFCEYTDDMLKTIMAKSTPISVNSERARNTYFNTLVSDIQNARKELKL